MKKMKVVMVVLVTVLSLNFALQAETLIDFDFTGLPGSDMGPLAATDSIADHVILADPGLGRGGTTGVSASNFTTGEFNWWMFNDADNPGSGWMTCTLEAEAGYALDLSSVTISAWRNGAGAPEDMRFLASTDGVNFSQMGDIIAELAAGDFTFRDYAFDLSSLPQTGYVELRFSPLPGTAVSNGWGNMHINDMFVEGTVATAAGQSNKDSVIVYESGVSDSFEVMLLGGTDPASPVTVSIDPNSPGFEAAASDIILTTAGTPTNTPGELVTLTFTQVNVPQAVTVSAVEDSPLEEGIEYARISFTLTGDAAYADGFIAPVDVTIVDADSASVITDLEGDLVLTEGDTVGLSFTIKLGSSPTADVMITFDNVADPNEVTINPESITFTSANYDTLQTVTVVAIDNDILAGVGTMENPAIERTMINFIIQTEDLAYAALPTQFIYGDIYDNECGAWGYKEADFNLDCHVNLADFATFANQWLASTDPKNP